MGTTKQNSCQIREKNKIQNLIYTFSLTATLLLTSDLSKSICPLIWYTILKGEASHLKFLPNEARHKYMKNKVFYEKSEKLKKEIFTTETSHIFIM